jgi:hypothetical protein
MGAAQACKMLDVFIAGMQLAVAHRWLSMAQASSLASACRASL